MVSCVKQIVSGDHSIYMTAWWSVMTQRGVDGVGEDIYVYIIMTDSRCCTAETIQHHKAILH